MDLPAQIVERNRRSVTTQTYGHGMKYRFFRHIEQPDDPGEPVVQLLYQASVQ